MSLTTPSPTSPASVAPEEEGPGLTPALLWRPSLADREEQAAARRHMPVVTDCVVGLERALVCARYTAIPLYDYALEEAIRRQGSALVNTRAQHRCIASFGYYEAIADLTPRTWFQMTDAPRDGGPFVLKGERTSKKYQFLTHMYAETYADAVRVATELRADVYIGAQPIIIREYVPLRVLETGINGLPFANEHRCFFYRGELLAHGFYWSEAEARGELAPAGLALAQEAARRLAPDAPFVAIDVAETADGRWIVIEVNDGQMSGLSCVEPEPFYAALAEAMRRDAAERWAARTR